MPDHCAGVSIRFKGKFEPFLALVLTIPHKFLRSLKMICELVC